MVGVTTYHELAPDPVQELMGGDDECATYFVLPPEDHSHGWDWLVVLVAGSDTGLVAWVH